jgi:signal transduction histidine kinase
MKRARIRTKLLMMLLLISLGLSIASLLIVRYSVQRHIRSELSAGLTDSIFAFQNAQKLREITLTQSAQLLANLPSLKALMTTQDPATINDAALDFWKVSGSDLFFLAGRTGTVVAQHTRSPGITRETAQLLLRNSLSEDAPTHWWFGGGHLYKVAVQPIYFGSESDPARSELGVVAVGYEIDTAIAEEVGRVARGEVAFVYAAAVVTTTLKPPQAKQLSGTQQRLVPGAQVVPVDLTLGGEHFLAGTVALSPGAQPQVKLIVLKSFDQATLFLKSLNQLLIALGVSTIVVGTGLVLLISNALTRPLTALVRGVRALQRGDYSYELVEKGSQEVAEVTAAFRDMRDTLHKTQQELLHAERMAMIGQMASSISHDMRHQLSAIYANAEFLCSTKLSAAEKEDLFQEIQTATNDMTDLIDSMIELSRKPGVLNTSETDVVAILDHAIRAVRSHPDHRTRNIELYSSGEYEGWFDARRLERAFYNLLLNAAEATANAEDGGWIHVAIARANGLIAIRIADNGPGIPAPMRDKIFDPFVGYGKEHGTGLGLTIAQKVLRDHGGDLTLEETAQGHTVFLAVLPACGVPDSDGLPPDAGKGSIAQSDRKQS